LADKTSDTIIKNTLFNYAGFGLRLVVSFFLVAYILNQLGKQQFGVYILIETMVTCLALLDIAGIEGAFVKFISEYHTKNDQNKLNQVVSLGFSYYLSFQAILCLAIYTFRQPLFKLFKLNADAGPDVSFVLLGFLFIALVRGSFRVYRSVLLGLQRMDMTNLIDIVFTIPNVLGTVYFLSNGWGIKGLIINGMIIAVLTVSGHIFCSYRILPGLRLRPFMFGKEIFKEAFFYGVKVQVARFAEIINAQIDKLLLGLILAQNSKTMVGFYELGAKPARIIRDLPSQLLPAILPAASQLDALEDKAALSKLYHRGSKYLAIITLPLAFFTIMNADMLINFWLGPGYPKVILALQVLSIGYTTTLLVGMGRLIARGIGVPHFEMHSSILITVLNVLLSAFLIYTIGFEGALLGTALSAIIGSIYFIIMFHKHLETSFWDDIFFDVYPIPAVACILALAGDHLLITTLNLAAAPVDRLSLFITLGGRAFIFFFIYGTILMITRYIDSYDKDVIRKVLRPFVKFFSGRQES